MRCESASRYLTTCTVPSRTLIYCVDLWTLYGADSDGYHGERFGVGVKYSPDGRRRPRLCPVSNRNGRSIELDLLSNSSPFGNLPLSLLVTARPSRHSPCGVTQSIDITNRTPAVCFPLRFPPTLSMMVIGSKQAYNTPSPLTSRGSSI